MYVWQNIKIFSVTLLKHYSNNVYIMTKKEIQIRNSTADFLIFTSQTNEKGIDVRVDKGTIWLSQKLIAQLFDCSVNNISLHLKKSLHRMS